ncbi:MAG TPA: DNA polymerase III subunit delta [Gaiellaceae bacterium]|nr:DNA polymerase III subunit delta [Gaiellaceae bacterium]
MSSEPLLPVYLLTGSDRPKVARALRRLRSRFGDESIEQLSADAAAGADAVAACNALGLFAGGDGGRLVIVDGVERWKKADVDAVAAYLADPVPGAVLALVAGEPPRSDALATAVAGTGRVLAYDAPKPRDLPAWVRAQFDGLGAAVDADAARALVEIVGDDLIALATEADKITIWAGGRPIARGDVERLATPAREAAAWATTDAWGERDAGALVAAAEAELERREPFSIAVRLAAHVSLVRSVKLLAAEGVGAREIAKRVKVHEFRVRKALGHADRYSGEELDAAVVRLAALDAALKGASRLSGALELTRALADLTEPVTAPARQTA